jgi:hypothetical protein
MFEIVEIMNDPKIPSAEKENEQHKQDQDQDQHE